MPRWRRWVRGGGSVEEAGDERVEEEVGEDERFAHADAAEPDAHERRAADEAGDQQRRQRGAEAEEEQAGNHAADDGDSAKRSENEGNERRNEGYLRGEPRRGK